MNAVFKLAPQRTTELNPAAPMLRYLRNDAGGRYFAGAHGGRPDGCPEPGNEDPAASFDRSGSIELEATTFAKLDNLDNPGHPRALPW